MNKSFIHEFSIKNSAERPEDTTNERIPMSGIDLLSSGSHVELGEQAQPQEIQSNDWPIAYAPQTEAYVREVLGPDSVYLRMLTGDPFTEVTTEEELDALYDAALTELDKLDKTEIDRDRARDRAYQLEMLHLSPKVQEAIEAYEASVEWYDEGVRWGLTKHIARLSEIARSNARYGGTMEPVWLPGGFVEVIADGTEFKDKCTVKITDLSDETARTPRVTTIPLDEMRPVMRLPEPTDDELRHEDSASYAERLHRAAGSNLVNLGFWAKHPGKTRREQFQSQRKGWRRYEYLDPIIRQFYPDSNPRKNDLRDGRIITDVFLKRVSEKSNLHANLVVCTAALDGAGVLESERHLLYDFRGLRFQRVKSDRSGTDRGVLVAIDSERKEAWRYELGGLGSSDSGAWLQDRSCGWLTEEEVSRISEDFFFKVAADQARKAQARESAEQEIGRLQKLMEDSGWTEYRQERIAELKSRHNLA